MIIEILHYSYESGDGTKAFERGELKTYEDKTAGEAVVGSFSYTVSETIAYVLDLINIKSIIMNLFYATNLHYSNKWM